MPSIAEVNSLFGVKVSNKKFGKGLSPFQAEMLSNFVNVIGRLDEKEKVNEKQLRKMIYNAGVYLYRSYHGLEKPDDFFHPSIHEEKKAHRLAGLIK